MRSFDEVNNINSLEGLKESVYYEYFSKMDLPDDEIAKRIMAAEDFENEFMVVLALALVLYQEGRFERQIIQTRFRDAYLKVGERYTPDDSWYVLQRAIEFSNEVADTTEEHLESAYYTSLDRAMRMSETESNVINNYRQFREAEDQGYTKKQWRTMLDKRVRESHKTMQGKTVGLHEYFDVNGYPMSFPADTSFSPPASLIVGCRCSLKFL